MSSLHKANSKVLVEKIVHTQLKRLDERSEGSSFDLKDAELLAKLTDVLVALSKPMSAPRDRTRRLPGSGMKTSELERYAMPDDSDESDN